MLFRSQKAKERLQDLEEKRYGLITEAERAERQERIAFATYGGQSKQAAEARSHAEKLQNNLLKNQWAIAKYNNDIELLKASAKGGMDANQIFTAKQKLLDSDEYAKWEQAMIKEYGDEVINHPDFAVQRELWLNNKLGLRATNKPPVASTSGYTIKPAS